jgi:hypothetical protein
LFSNFVALAMMNFVEAVAYAMMWKFLC